MGRMKELLEPTYDETYPDTPGFVAGSDTSEAAAEATQPKAKAMRALVAAYIARKGMFGATCDEVEIILSMRHQTASARVRELVLLGTIFDTGERRKTRSGSPARIYRMKS